MGVIEQMANIFPENSSFPKDYPQPFIEQREYLVDGQIRRWPGAMQDILSPIYSSGKPTLIGNVPMLHKEEALEALECAAQAYKNGHGQWPTMGVEGRIRAIKEFTMAMKEKRSEVINLLMWEIGKNLADSTKEFDRTIEYIEDTVEALKDLDRASSRFTIQEGIIGQIRRAPYGVVLCMGPFNYPLNETFTTLIPALIMGNTVIFKPAKLGVLLFNPLLEAFQKSFPKGVINTVYGDGPEVIGPIMESGKVDVLAFIGSYRTAIVLEKQHPRPNRLHTVLGLSAKNPGIVLEDADIDQAVKECVLGSLSFNGQRCTALKILFVHRKIAEEFVRKFSDAVSALKPGLPWTEGVSITPLPEPGKCAKMSSFVEDGVNLGAKVTNQGGGEIIGSLFFPAVLFPCTPEMKIYNEEQFGPVVPIVPFEFIEEPIGYITSSIYGQQVSLFGKNPETLSKLIDPLTNQVSRVNINSQCQRGPDSFPFTGRKDSADGTLSISDALRVFSIRSLVAAKETDQNSQIFREILRGRKSNFLNTDFIF